MKTNAAMMNAASIIAKARGAMLLTLALCLAAAVATARADTLAADINETVFKLPVTVRDGKGRDIKGDMVVTQFKPDGAGPFPIAVMLHGRGPDRSAVARFRYTDAARYFVRRGFAVWVPTRLGYGDSGVDNDPEGHGSCTSKFYPTTYEAAASSALDVIAFARQQPFADPSRVIVLGQSVGGATAIAVASKHPDGLLGVINFAGGGGGDPIKRPGQPCRADGLRGMFADYGATTRLPTLWIYTANDQWMGNVEPPRWFGAFAKAGGTGEFIALPAFGDDGHLLFARGFGVWRILVDSFLAKRGFKAPVSADAPPVSNFATLGDLQKVPLRTADARERYAHFLQLDVPRAFAIGPRGEYAFYSAAADASTRALARCRDNAHAACKLYAVDDQVVWPSDSAPVTAGAPKESTQ